RGISTALTAESEIFNPPIAISLGGDAEQCLSSQVIFSPSIVATRRDMVKSGLPLSTHPRMRLVEPSGRNISTSITRRLWSSAMGTVTDFEADPASCA